jgi:hypothetical protein
MNLVEIEAGAHRIGERPDIAQHRCGNQEVLLVRRACWLIGASREAHRMSSVNGNAFGVALVNCMK